MIFIGTKKEISPQYLSGKINGLHIELVSGEYLPVRAFFKNTNINLVTSSRGCSCDLSVPWNKNLPVNIDEGSALQHFISTIRKLTGSYDDWLQRHNSRINAMQEDRQKYLAETWELIDIILSLNADGEIVEAYCTWAGDYADAPEVSTQLDTSKNDLREIFEIEERQFITFH